MYRKSLAAIGIAALLVLAHGSGHGSTTVNIGKAREFIDAGNFGPAAELLNDVARDDPTSVEGRLLLGTALLGLNDFNGAEAALDEAVALDAAAAGQAGEICKKQVIEALRRENLEAAKGAFSLAIKYDPTLRDEVSRACIDKGRFYVESGRDREADELFRFVLSYDSSLRDRVCDVLFAKARSATGEESLRLLLASLRYGDRYQEETSRMYLNLANSLDGEETRVDYLARAEEYFGRDRILQASVDYYTERWGAPERISLVDAEKWISVEKPRRRWNLRYLAVKDFRTRDAAGPLRIGASIFQPGSLPGEGSGPETGTPTAVWLSMDAEPTIVFYWFNR